VACVGSILKVAGRFRGFVVSKGMIASDPGRNPADMRRWLPVVERFVSRSELAGMMV
jgi:hypothetical protein